MSRVSTTCGLTALPNWLLLRQLSPMPPETPLTSDELLVLLALQFLASQPGLALTYATICQLTSINEQAASAAMRSLQERGIVRRIKTDQGNVYVLHLHETIETPVVVQALETKKKKEDRGIKPVRASRIKATADMVPLKLQSVSSCICNFFNNHKGGQKTKQAFDGLMENLLKIHDDPGGGIKAVKAQLEEGINRSTQGEKKWASITYNNWQRFGAAKSMNRSGVAYAIHNANRPSTQPLVNLFDEDEAVRISL